MPGIIGGTDCIGDTIHTFVELIVYCKGKDDNKNNFICECLHHQILKCYETLKRKGA